MSFRPLPISVFAVVVPVSLHFFFSSDFSFHLLLLFLLSPSYYLLLRFSCYHFQTSCNLFYLKVTLYSHGGLNLVFGYARGLYQKQTIIDLPDSSTCILLFPAEMFTRGVIAKFKIAEPSPLGFVCPHMCVCASQNQLAMMRLQPLITRQVSIKTTLHRAFHVNVYKALTEPQLE